jgi:hypothetical protein
MYILVYIKKIYVHETKSKRDKHNFKYFKGAQFEFLPRAPFYIDTLLHILICKEVF